MEHGTTVGAARDLGVSQPSVSRLLAEFESLRGEELFTRANGRLIPRHGAEMLLSDVTRALAQVDGIAEGTGRGTPLTFAAPGGIISAIFAPACRALLADYPDLRVGAEIMSYHDTLNAVAMGRVDAGLVKGPVDHPAVAVVPLVTVGTDVVMPEGHPLLARPVIRIADLHGAPLVLLGRNRPFRVQLDRLLAQAGVVPVVMAETQAVSAACAFVAQGIGMTIANALLSRSELRPGLACRPFDAGILHEFCLIHPLPSQRPGLISALAGCLGTVIRETLS